jgi:hypothetical protein
MKIMVALAKLILAFSLGAQFALFFSHYSASPKPSPAVKPCVDGQTLKPGEECSFQITIPTEPAPEPAKKPERVGPRHA